MEIQKLVTKTVTFNLADLETYLREKKLISGEYVLTGIVSSPAENQIRLSFVEKTETNGDQLSMQEKFLNRLVKDVWADDDISVRLYKRLQETNIIYIKDITGDSLAQLMKKEGFGAKSLRELRGLFMQYGVDHEPIWREAFAKNRKETK